MIEGKALHRSASILSEELLTDDDVEAEIILDALSWTSSNNSAPSELRQALKKQSEDLNVEIIDFLLQWENDEIESASRKSSHASNESRFHDTFRVLDALKDVDNELAGIGDWLEDQLSHLTQIKSKLTLIEAENGSLESSWQNLSNVQQIIETFMTELSLTEQEEQVLLKPEAIVEGAFKLADLTRVDMAIRPLIEAVSRLKEAIDFGNGQGTQLTKSQWRHIKSLSAVIEQRKRLADIAFNFCNSFAPTANTIFNAILRHKSLHNTYHPEICIDLRSLNFSVILREGFRYSLYVMSGPMHREGLFVNEPPLSLSPSDRIDFNNAALVAVNAYHSSLAAFLPILEALIYLTPSLRGPLSDAYVKATHERLYVPMIKTVFRDLHSLITTKTVPVTLANIPKYRLAEQRSFQPPVRFAPPAAMPSKSSRGDSETSNLASQIPLTTWSALGAAILVFMPVIKREETLFLSLFKYDAGGMGELVAPSAGTGTGSFDTSSSKSKAEEMLDQIFNSLQSKLIRTGGSSSVTTGITGGGESLDGIEAIGMLMVLQQFMIDHLGLAPAESMTSTAAAPSSSSSATAVAQETYKHPDCCSYLIATLLEVRLELLRRLKLYLSEQLAWIQQQKGDPKKAGVQGVVSRFPALVVQALEMTGGQRVDFVEQFLFRVAKEVFQWIASLAEQNEKYHDIVKIQNYAYLAEALSPMDVLALEKFVVYATHEAQEAESRYVRWMVSYEFPALSALTHRVEGVGGKVREEELSLYIRRKEVLTVVKELTQKALADSITSMHKRLQKHFGSAPSEQELDMVGRLWASLRNRVVGVLEKLDEAATASYQINLDVRPHMVAVMFDRFTGPQ